MDSPDALALNGLLEEEAPPDPADPEGGGPFLVLPSAPSGRLSRAKVTIGAVSEELAALSGVRCPPRGWDPYLEYHAIPQMSMRVSGIDLETHDDALHVIESIVFSWLLQLEVVLGLRCTVEKVSANTAQRVDLVHHGDISDLDFPTSRYDPEAVLLYWHANGLFGQPILQFLAYYQVVEYYFNRYAQAEAQRRVRKVLTSPGFSPHRAEDILRLMGAIRGGDRNTFGDERSQFRATMNECIEAEDLSSFLHQTEPIRNYLTTKGWAEISKVGVALNSKTASDLRPVVAERLYDIRCRIVHTKSATSDEGEIVRVLPVSREAANLTFDTQVMKWVAQRVLFTSGSHLDL